MRVRRTLATVLAVSSLFLATACAGDDLAEDDEPAADDTASSTDAGSGGGPVTISGQSFPEAALVASMYEQLLADAGYDPRSSWSTPATATCRPSPAASTSCRSTSAAS